MPIKGKDVNRSIWLRGLFQYKLRDYQYPIYEAMQAAMGSIFVLDCSRRLGKTTMMLIDSLSYAYRNQKSVIGFLAPEQKQIRSIIDPIMREILIDCPEDLKPTFREKDSVYVFFNGSRIQLAGTDGGHSESLRGMAMRRCYIDEAGSCDDLDYIVDSIIRPQTIDNKGKIIVGSTPPVTPDHPFDRLCEQAKKDGTYIHRNIYDNTSLDAETIETYKRESGGEQTSTWKREYMAMHVIETRRAILPEFQAVRDAIVRQVDRPRHFYPIVSMDVGFRDKTAILFGYVDFQRASLVIEREIVVNGINTTEIATGVKEMEASLWPGMKVYARYCDIDLLLIHDLTSLHGLNFIPTDKEGKDIQINELRVKLSQGKILINPACTNLIYQFATGVWNKTHTSFERSEIGGHCDAIDAAIYMMRNAPWHSNPFPAMEGIDIHTHYIYQDPKTNRDDSLKALSQAFKR